MRYVYLLQSESFPKQRYIGSTGDFERRLREHNSGRSKYTARFKPWKPILVIAFSDELKAVAFEVYLKSGSGHAFSARHFW
mgnify:CR=1 FL=1